MTAKSSSTTEVIAYLYAVERRTPSEIKVLLDVSEVTVWRHLEIARSQPGPVAGKTLVTEPAPLLNVEEDERERIRVAAERRKVTKDFPDLLERLKNAIPWQGDEPHPLKGVWVFPSGHGADSLEDSEAWDQASWSFGHAAAPRVADLLRPAHCIGVAWGRTLQSVTHGLVEQNLNPRAENNRAVVFPVSGDVLADVQGEDVSGVFPDQTRLSPSYIASQLATALNGSPTGALSLLSVSAIIPLKYHKRVGGSSKADVIKQFIGETLGYQRIFGGGGKGKPSGRASGDSNGAVPLVDEMDTLLVAIGSSEFPARFFSRSILNYLGKTVEEICDLTHGDIGAVLVPRETLGKTQERDFRSIVECFTGIKLRHIRQCASKAQAGGTGGPGVIVFGVGRSRLRIIRECIRRGLANHVVIDKSLAKALQEDLAEKNVGEK